MSASGGYAVLPWPLAALAAAALVFAAPASADPQTWPPGRYLVPDDMPYGTYRSSNTKPGTYPGCLYTTYTREGLPLEFFNGTFSKTSTVELDSPQIGMFTSTKGCTDWVKIG
jgi:hypothetical protein